MPLVLTAEEDENTLQVERRLYAKRFILTVDRNKCKGCGICEQVCHAEAITLNLMPKEFIDGEERAVKAKIQIDPQKCDHCGMCEAICPFAAIEHKVNGNPIVSVVETGSFPEYIREIVVDTSKCDLSCVDCEEACPLNLISVKVVDKDGNEVEDIANLKKKKGFNEEDYQIVVEID